MDNCNDKTALMLALNSLIKFKNKADSTSHHNDLLISVEQPTEEIYSLLGSDLEKQDKEGKTALHYALSLGLDDLALRIISKQNDLEIKDSKGRSAVFMAVKFSCEESFLKLIEKAVDLKLVTKDGRSLFSAAAARENSIYYYGKLLEVGIKPDHGSAKRALSIEIQTLEDESSLDNISFLLENGACVNPLYDEKESFVFHAILKRNLSLLKLLIKYDVDLSVKSADKGFTPLEFLEYVSANAKEIYRDEFYDPFFAPDDDELKQVFDSMKQLLT